MNQKLLEECGFHSYEDVIQKITQIVEVMKAGRMKF